MTDPENLNLRKTTAFGEALWVDVLKTIGVGFGTLGVMLIIGLLISLIIVSPWGRASPECSMWCVLEMEFNEIFPGGDKAAQ